MAKIVGSEFEFFALDLWNSLEGLIKPCVDRIRERQEIMKVAQEKRTAPAEYLRTLQKIAPKHPDDWRAGDVFFLQRYQNDTELYQKLLKVRENYFLNSQ